MIDPLTLSIGTGLVIGLIFVEYFGLSTGGMVVPGYIALDIYQPTTVIITLIDSLVIYGIICLLARIMVIYGRRRIALIMLISFLLGAFVRYMLSSLVVVSSLGGVYSVIGYIIPGLIALSIDRQGIIETFTSLITASIVVRLILIILIGPVLAS